MTWKELQIIGLVIAIPLMGYALRINDYWAEPEPPKHDPVITVEVSNRVLATTDDESLTVERMEMSDEAILAEEKYSDSLELLACAVQAESGNQPLEGKKLVVDVILNRVDSPDFPNDIDAVLNQSGQFGVVRNGSINKVEPTDETWEAVLSEIESRTNSEVIYFQAGSFSSYGHDWKKIGDHYFSTK